MATGLSIIIATSGRPSLANTLESLRPQLAPGDELLVDVNDDAPYGHRARNRMMAKAKRGNGVCFIDDDDVYLPGALKAMRAAFTAQPDRIHVFRMIYRSLGDGRWDVLWRTPELACGNISTQQFVVPREVALSSCWTDRYEGDWDFISAAAANAPVEWHERIVAHYRPAQEMVITNPANGNTVMARRIPEPLTPEEMASLRADYEREYGAPLPTFGKPMVIPEDVP